MVASELDFELGEWQSITQSKILLKVGMMTNFNAKISKKWKPEKIYRPLNYPGVLVTLKRVGDPCCLFNKTSIDHPPKHICKVMFVDSGATYSLYSTSLLTKRGSM